MRRTQRRYSDRPVPEALVRLLLAAAFSASSKSDYQQASVIWLKDRAGATGSPRCSRTCRGSARRRCFWCFSATRGGSNGSAKCAATRRTTARWKASSTPRSTPRWRLQTCILAAETWARHLPDQRLAQPHRRGRRDPRTARQGVPGRGAVPRLSGAAGVHQHASAAGGDRAYRPLRRCRGWPTAVDGYDRRRDARHSIKDRQRDPARFGTAEFYGWSEDKARQAVTAEGVGFAAWLSGARLHLRQSPETAKLRLPELEPRRACKRERG